MRKRRKEVRIMDPFLDITLDYYCNLIKYGKSSSLEPIIHEICDMFCRNIRNTNRIHGIYIV
jgi:RAB protein geranylgeranyltransferase component A